ncbi:MAG: hypothetical protein DIU84_05185, partial [Bacillota bacterium]
LVGERRGRVFRLGNAVRVRLGRVDALERRLDFELVEGEDEDGLGDGYGPGGRRRRRGGSRRRR